MMFKNLVFSFFICAFLSSCYAFLRADKVIYSGSIAKSPQTIVVDSIYNSVVE